MPLAAIIEDKTAIPAGLESFYTESDGKFVLQVDGMKLQADFDNYAEALKKRFTDAAADFSKNNNAGFTRDDVMAAIKEQFEKFQAPKPGAKPNGDGGDPPSGDVAARLHDLERNAKSQTETITKLTEERDAALGASRSTTIKNALNSAAQKAGATPEGINNLVTLVESNFELTQDGQIVTKLDSKTTSPNTSPDDFFSAAAREKQYRMFWPASKGAGADNDGDPGSGGDLGSGNPWTIKGWNMTKQSEVYKNSAVEAERLAKAAGVKLGAVAGIR